MGDPILKGGGWKRGCRLGLRGAPAGLEGVLAPPIQKESEGACTELSFNKPTGKTLAGCAGPLMRPPLGWSCPRFLISGFRSTLLA